MKLLRLSILGFACLWLAACGGSGSSGDGGGGGDTPPNSFRITLDRTSLTFDFFQGTPSAPQIVVANATGEYSGTIYVSAIIEGDGLEQTIPVSLSGTQGTIQISADESLAPGQYSGRVLALVCSDPQCANRIGGTPLPITYTVNVRRTVEVGANRAVLSAPENSTAMTSFIAVTPAETLTTFNLTPSASWLQVIDVTPAGFRVVAGPRPPGRYSGTIDVGSGPTIERVSVDFTSTYAPGNARGLYATPEAMMFNLMPGMQSSQGMSVSYQAESRAQASYVAPSAGTWLTVTGTNPYTVNVSTEGLAYGTYTGVIHVEAIAASDAVDVVDVVLNVGPTLTATAIGEISVDSSTLAADFERSSTIQFLGDAGGSWTATTDAPWIELTRSSGAAGAALELSVSQALLPSLDNFATHRGNIHIVSSRAGVREIDVPVVLHKNIAQVIGVGPQIQISGRGLKTVVRGRGFIAAGEGRVQIAGATIIDATIVDDTTLILETPALTAGTYAIDVRNELGLTTSASTLRVIDPVAPAYAVAPTGGEVRSIFLDPLRTNVYGVRIFKAQELLRFRLAGGTWQRDVIDVPDLYNAGLSNDGSTVVITSGPVTGGPGRLSYRDADTLVEQAHFDSLEGIRRPFYIFGVQGPLTFTNDNRLWLATPRDGGFDNNWLTYFDPMTGLFQHQPDRLGTSYVRTPKIAVSRNGQQLLVDGTVWASSVPVLTLSASASEFVATELTANCYGTLSDHAERTACGARIYDADMHALTTLQLDAADLNLGWTLTNMVLLSPDGNYAYAYAINSHDFTYMPSSPAPPPTYRPRVYVFDISSNTPTANIVSSMFFAFDTLAFPGCREFESSSCEARLSGGAIAPDGQTLYFAGDANLIVLPVPAQYR